VLRQLLTNWQPQPQITSDFLYRKFTSSRATNEAQFDKVYGFILSNFSSTLYQLMSICQKESERLNQPDNRHHLRVALLSITNHVLNTFELCIDLLRRGYRFQIPILARNINEALCVTLCIASDADLFAKIEKGNFRSKNAIAYVRKLFPEFVGQWDFLSQQFVHVNLKEYFQFATLMSEKDDEATKGCIHILSSLLIFAGVVFEFVFFLDYKLHMFWVRLDSGKTQWFLTQLGKEWLLSVDETLDTMESK